MRACRRSACGNGAEPETLDIHQSSGVSEANIQRDFLEELVTEGAERIPFSLSKIADEIPLASFFLRKGLG